MIWWFVTFWMGYETQDFDSPSGETNLFELVWRLSIQLAESLNLTERVGMWRKCCVKPKQCKWSCLVLVWISDVLVWPSVSERMNYTSSRIMFKLYLFEIRRGSKSYCLHYHQVLSIFFKNKTVFNSALHLYSQSKNVFKIKISLDVEV